MPRKPIELPPTVARRFVEDMRAYFAEPNGIKQDEGLAPSLSINDPGASWRHAFAEAAGSA